MLAESGGSITDATVAIIDGKPSIETRVPLSPILKKGLKTIGGIHEGVPSLLVTQVLDKEYNQA